MFNIDIFSWQDWDAIDSNTLQFYNVEFAFASMKKFNGFTIVKDFEGRLMIYDTDNKVVYDDYIINIPEFRAKLLGK